MSRYVVPLIIALVVASMAVGPGPVAGDGIISVSATVSPEQPVPEESFTVEAIVSNSVDSTEHYLVDELEVRRGPESDSELIADRDVSVRAGPGESRTLGVNATLNETGTQTVYLHVRLIDGGGDRAQIVQPVTVEVIQPHPQLQLDIQTALPNTTRMLNVTVANGLETDVRQVAVTVTSSAATINVTERVRARIASGATATFQFPARVTEAARYPITVTLAYTVGDDRREVIRTFDVAFDAPSNPGRVVLTGIEVQRTPTGGVELSATASNVGGTPVQSVVVSVPDRGGVRGTDFFVGTIPESDFSAFTISTVVSENRTTLPVEVTYIVDGIERTNTQEVRLGPVPEPNPDGTDSGLPVLPIGIVGALILLAVAYLWRR